MESSGNSNAAPGGVYFTHPICIGRPFSSFMVAKWSISYPGNVQGA